MEQQNQQPIQEKTESKPPIKTNWKYIAIVVVLGLVFGIGILVYHAQLKGFIGGNGLTPIQPTGISRAQIDDCVQDNECILVDYRDCCVPPQIAINKKYKAEYERHPEWQKASEERLRSFCAVVKCVSPGTFDSAKCVKNQCVGIRAEKDNKKVLDTSTWQTYRNTKTPEDRYKLVEISFPPDAKVINVSAEFPFTRRIDVRNIDAEERFRFSFSILDENEFRINQDGVATITQIDALKDEWENYFYKPVYLEQIQMNAMQGEILGRPASEAYIHEIDTDIRISPYIYSFTFEDMDPPQGDEISSLAREVNDQILSTFRFTPPAP